MPNLELARLRLHAQRIAGHRFGEVREVVRWMGALQAQDLAASLWALGLRTEDATLSDIAQSVERREIARTWPMRGTLHWVPANDLRWMVELMAPRAMAKAAARTRQLEIDAEVLSKARALLERLVTDGPPITRPEAYATFAATGLNPQGQRGIHILQCLAHEAFLCFGPHRGRQPTFVLVDQWLPNARAKPRDESIDELARRYFTSHGPATVNDFAWWTGLTLADARAALESARPGLQSFATEGRDYWFATSATSSRPAESAMYLLPGFDEYILGYKDRTAVLAPEFATRIVPGNNGMFMATMLSERGEVLGTWRKRTMKSGVAIEPEPFEQMPDDACLARAVSRYARFLEVAE